MSVSHHRSSCFTQLLIWYRKRSDLFRVLGQFVAKALLDSRIIDLAFNRTFLKLIMSEEISRSIDTLMVRLTLSFA